MKQTRDKMLNSCLWARLLVYFLWAAIRKIRFHLKYMQNGDKLQYAGIFIWIPLSRHTHTLLCIVGDHIYSPPGHSRQAITSWSILLLFQSSPENIHGRTIGYHIMGKLGVGWDGVRGRFWPIQTNFCSHFTLLLIWLKGVKKTTQLHFSYSL